MDAVSLHRMLLRIAGWADDTLVATARTWLAQGRTTEVAQVVRYAAVSGRIPMLGEDIDALATLLAGPGEPLPIERADHLALPCVAFTTGAPPSAAPTPAGAGPTMAASAASLDAVDEAVVAGIEHDAEGSVSGVWRVWRTPALPTPWPPPRRVFLIQVAGPWAVDRLVTLTARRQEVLARAGEPTPQIEVFTDPDSLPPYQRAALAAATLLWGRRGTAPLAVAPVFDPVAPAGGPGFASTSADGVRAALDPAERETVLNYLERGSLVLAGTVRLDDVIDATSVGVVPTGFCSDGTWVWSEASTYYLRRHGIAPHAALVQHIRRTGTPPGLDATGRHRALAALRVAADSGSLG